MNKLYRKKICIIIPIYKEILTENERLSIRKTQQVLNIYDIYFITYKELNLAQYRKYKKIKICYFPKKYFEDSKSYSRLLLNPIFYVKFLNYEYMCIVQTDAMILGTVEQLKEFIYLKYDYIGAPWKEPFRIHRFEPSNHFWILELFPNIKNKMMGKETVCYVGNGGLSLRNIKNTIKLLLKYWIFSISWWENEDLFFAYYGACDGKTYKLPEKNTAKKFSVETTAKADIDKGVCPFGIHAWEIYYPGLLEKYNY